MVPNPHPNTDGRNNGRSRKPTPNARTAEADAAAAIPPPLPNDEANQAGLTASVGSFDSDERFAWDGDETGTLFLSDADPNLKTAVAPYSTRFCSLATIVEESDHEVDTISLNPTVLALNNFASAGHPPQPSCNAVHPANTPTIRLPKALLKLLTTAPVVETRQLG